MKKKKEILQTSRKPLYKLLQTLRKSLFFFLKKKEILQTSQKPLYKKGFKKVQVSTGTALAFILLETAKKKEILQTSRKPLHKLLQTFRKSLFFFDKKKKRFYKLPGNLFTKKVLKKFKLELELPWRLFFWKLRRFIGKLIALFNSNVIFQP